MKIVLLQWIYNNSFFLLSFSLNWRVWLPRGSNTLGKYSRDPLINSWHRELSPFPKSVFDKLCVRERRLLWAVTSGRRKISIIQARVTMIRLLMWRSVFVVTPFHVVHVSRSIRTSIYPCLVPCVKNIKRMISLNYIGE